MIFFISYPKSGRTWCRYIFYEYAKRSKTIRKNLIFSHITFGNSPEAEDEGKKWLEKGTTRILLKRNDLDVLVSLYHDQIKRVPGVAEKYKTIDEFVLDKAKHLDEFTKQSKKLKYKYEISYELMLRNPYTAFYPAMKIVFGDVDIEKYKEAIEFCQFDNLYKLEREGKVNLHGRGLIYKTRKGKVGSFKEELKPETIEMLRNRHSLVNDV